MKDGHAAEAERAQISEDLLVKLANHQGYLPSYTQLGMHQIYFGVLIRKKCLMVKMIKKVNHCLE